MGRLRSSPGTERRDLTNISLAYAVGYSLAVAYLLAREDVMKQSDHFRENAENCRQLAEGAPDHPSYLRYKRMEDAWRSLADEQDWLDGEMPPAVIAVT
jgi:hypothetical protein